MMRETGIAWWDSNGIKPSLITDSRRLTNWFRWIDSESWHNQRVIEVGTGTGILAQRILDLDARQVRAWEHNEAARRVCEHLMSHEARFSVSADTFSWSDKRIWHNWHWLVHEVFGDDIWSEGANLWLPRPHRTPWIRVLPNRWRMEVWRCPITRELEKTLYSGYQPRPDYQCMAAWHHQARQHRRWPLDDIPVNPQWRTKLESLWRQNQPVLTQTEFDLSRCLKQTHPDQWQMMAHYELDFEHQTWSSGDDHHSSLTETEWSAQIPTGHQRSLWVVCQSPGHLSHLRREQEGHQQVDWWQQRPTGDRAWLKTMRNSDDDANWSSETSDAHWAAGYCQFITSELTHRITCRHQQISSTQIWPSFSVTAHTTQGDVQHEWFHRLGKHMD